MSNLYPPDGPQPAHCVKCGSVVPASLLRAKRDGAKVLIVLRCASCEHEWTADPFATSPS
jgi:hypothetical protein